MKKIILWIVVLGVVGTGVWVFGGRWQKSEQGGEGSTQADYQNIAYEIEGKMIKLMDGAAQTEAAPGSASMITTKYFLII